MSAAGIGPRERVFRPIGHGVEACSPAGDGADRRQFHGCRAGQAQSRWRWRPSLGCWRASRSGVRCGGYPCRRWGRRSGLRRGCVARCGIWGPRRGRRWRWRSGLRGWGPAGCGLRPSGRGALDGPDQQRSLSGSGVDGIHGDPAVVVVGPNGAIGKHVAVALEAREPRLKPIPHQALRSCNTVLGMTQARGCERSPHPA